MDWVNLALAVVGAIAGVAGSYFGYVGVRGQLRRRRRSGPEQPAPELPPDARYDAFVSYAEVDEDKAERLANSLRNRGLRVFMAKWIDVGLNETLERERALLGSANGVLLFSRTTMSDEAIRTQYAALLDRVHTGGRRFVPVLVEDVELPPFARTRRPLDLRDPSDYEARVDQLARAVRPHEPDPAT